MAKRCGLHADRSECDKSEQRSLLERRECDSAVVLQCLVICTDKGGRSEDSVEEKYQWKGGDSRNRPKGEENVVFRM